MIHQYLVKGFLLISQKENDISIDLNKKHDHHLIKIRKSLHQEYIISNCNAIIDDISKDTQIQDYNHDFNKNSIINELVDSISHKAKTKSWPRGTCLVTGDSMLSYIDETRISRKPNVKVRSFPGAKTGDMFHYVVPLLEKDPDYVILHVDTNNTVCL